MTINQGSGQPDPTSISPIVFDVLFDEPVTGFTDPADVDLTTSTAGGTLAAAISDAGDADPATYTVSVTGMTTNGAVIASVPAGAAQDAAIAACRRPQSFDGSAVGRAPARARARARRAPATRMARPFRPRPSTPRAACSISPAAPTGCFARSARR